MKLNTIKLHTDILVKLNKFNMTIETLCFDLGFSLSIIKAVRLGENITVNNLLKITTWLDNGIEKYIIHD